MNFRRTIQNYRTWLILSCLLVSSSLFLLGNMVNQLSSDVDSYYIEDPGEFYKLQDTHLRSIRNYEQRPKEELKLLQVLLPPNRNKKLTQEEAVKVLSNSHDSDHETKEKQNQMIIEDLKMTKNNDKVLENDDFKDDGDEQNNESKTKITDDNENREFQPGDFMDVVEFEKLPFKYEEITPSTKTVETGNIKRNKHIRVLGIKRKHFLKKSPRKYTGLSSKKPDFIQGPFTEGIYWTRTAVETVPKGKSSTEISHSLSYIRHQPVRRLTPPEWNKCGRPLNGIVTLRDGSMMCARYRTPHNRFILGESVSFHLSRLLGMDNIPPVVLSLVNDTQPQWYGVNFTRLHWQSNQVIALIDWVPDLNIQGSQVVIPQLIHEAYMLNTSVTPSVLARHRLQRDELSQLIQWGIMIIFDYLTGNYDRFASMQDAADKDKKPSILTEHVRNLKQSAKTNKLWLIDNESGLFDAYDLLYMERRGRFLEFHRRMLQTMCVFHKDLVQNVEKLSHNIKPDVILFEYARSQERLIDRIPKDYKDKSFELFQEMFPVRLKEVLQWIRQCHQHNVQEQHNIVV